MALAPGEYMFQSDGIYNPNTVVTSWNAPYLSNLKVGSLSAISANMGTITAGDLSIGSSPEISGTTMTGSGAHIYANGRLVTGNSTNNIVFDGTSLFLNVPFLQNPQTLNQTIAVASNTNALSVGQITIANGVEVSVPTGSGWTII
jgi:hypothetical protein